MFFLLADSHCHLDWFKEPENVVQRALNNNVQRINSNAVNIGSIKKNLVLKEKFDSVDISLGLHPSEVLGMSEKEINEGITLVEKNISNIVAVGEIGMDFKHGKERDERIKQEMVFRKFIEIALDNDLPLVVHARYCETQCLDILEEMGAKKVLMHWFTNSKKTSSRAVSLGYRISCGPIILSDEQSAGIVGNIPFENLLLETDAPVAFKGRQSEPSWIPLVCEKVAELNQAEKDKVEQITFKNYCNLFGIDLK